MKDIYKPKEMAELLNVTVKTLQRWDNTGKLIAYRTPTDRRYYTKAQYLQITGQTNQNDNDNRKTVIYARVSNRTQEDDMKNQVSFLRQFCNGRGTIVDQVIEDIGSGLNYKRKKWNDLLDQVMNHEVKQIVIAEKDRFVRFGYDWFEHLCNRFDCEIVVVNNPDMSPNEELVQDIISILHVFSCRIYGLRKYKKQLQGDKALNG